MTDVRCKNCNKVLAKVVVMIGAVKCTRCKMIFEYNEHANMYQSSTYTNSSYLQYKKGCDIVQNKTTESEPSNN